MPTIRPNNDPSVEQLSLFPFDLSEPETPATTPAVTVLTVPVIPSPVKTKTVKSTRPAKPQCPQELLSIRPVGNNLEELLNRFLSLGSSQWNPILLEGRNIIESIENDRIFYKGKWKQTYQGFSFYEHSHIERYTYNNADIFAFEENRCRKFAQLIFVDKELNCWTALLEVKTESMDAESRNACGRYFETVTGITLSSWKLTDKVIPDMCAVQSPDELLTLLRSRNPYAADFCEKNGYDPLNVILAPWTETLSKAGYSITGRLKFRNHQGKSEIEKINRLCQRGSSPKDIFKTTKNIYTLLKNENNIETWDVYRRMNKFGRIKPDSLKQIYDADMKLNNLEIISSILGKTHNNKPVFSWDSLVNYLGRLNQYEAIETDQALELINDYLRMCQVLDMKPRIDGDSLKREHDIAARLCREQHNSILAKAMENGCRDSEKYNYREQLYFIRAITDYDTLLDEAKQQHNCVASYSQSIAGGKSFIYQMRSTTLPEQSLITIELSPDGKTIRQKYLSCNRPIHNKSQSDFIDRWFRYVQTVK